MSVPRTVLDLNSDFGTETSSAYPGSSSSSPNLPGLAESPDGRVESGAQYSTEHSVFFHEPNYNYDYLVVDSVEGGQQIFQNASSLPPILEEPASPLAGVLPNERPEGGATTEAWASSWSPDPDVSWTNARGPSRFSRVLGDGTWVEYKYEADDRPYWVNTETLEHTEELPPQIKHEVETEKNVVGAFLSSDSMSPISVRRTESSQQWRQNAAACEAVLLCTP